MKLRSRTLLEKFSAFIVTDSRESVRWSIDREAQRHFQQLLRQNSEGKERDWFSIFCRDFLENPEDRLTKLHLLSYFQEACNGVASKISAAPWFGFLYPELRYGQIFSMVNEFLWEELFLILKVYNPKESRLNNWLTYKLESLVKERLRQGREKVKYTVAGLLKTTSQKALEDALEFSGILRLDLWKVSELHFRKIILNVSADSTKNQEYFQALRCYKQVLAGQPVAGFNRIQKINKKTINLIHECYNNLGTISNDPEEMRSILQSCHDILERSSIHFHYVLLWKIYKNRWLEFSEANPPTVKRYPWPPENWELQEIADIYNQQRPYPAIFPPLNGSQVREYLELCDRALRQRDMLRIESTDDSLKFPAGLEQIEVSGESGEEILGWDEVSSTSQRVLQEIDRLLKAQNPIDRLAIQLSMGLGLNLADVGSILNLGQSQVTRKNQKVKKRILQNIAVHLSEEFEIPLNTQTLGRELYDLFESTLENHLKSEVWNHLERRFQANFFSELTWLKRWDAVFWECGGREREAIAAIAKEFSEEEMAVQKRLDNIEQQLYLDLVNVYQSNINNEGFLYDLKTLPSTKKSFQKLVKYWILNTRLY
ncbi:DNA-directed RNA polymerase specialized sigma subunit [Geitlerinema sp. FC II]|nr:DNA-directed RNA polymerase specialized sigma subunit [Geitlerinema sp. FC II]